MNVSAGAPGLPSSKSFQIKTKQKTLKTFHDQFYVNKRNVIVSLRGTFVFFFAVAFICKVFHDSGFAQFLLFLGYLPETLKYG